MMEYNEQTIRTKIIPHLFFTRNGDRLFDSAKTYFDDNCIKWEHLLHEIKTASLDDKLFWKKLIDILRIVYDENIDYNEAINEFKDTNKFINKLLILRFDYEFTADENFSIENIESFNLFLQEKIDTDENLIINENGITRIALVNIKSESGYFSPFEPGTIELYPISLIKIDQQNKKLAIHGYKRRRTTFVNQINEFDENLICKHEITELLPLKFNTAHLFSVLREKDIFLKKINLKCSYFNLNLSVTGDNILEIDEFINPEFIFNDLPDLLKIKEMQFIYPYEIKEKKEIKEIIFKVSINENGQQRNGLEEKYFIFSLNIMSKYKDIDISDAEDKIVHEIENIGMKIGKAYKMPSSYYFSNLINSSNHSKKKYLKILKEDADAKPVIMHLFENKVITDTDDSLIFDIEKYSNILSSIFSSLKGAKGDFSTESFEILGIVQQKKRIELRIKLYCDDKNSRYTNYYTVLFGFNTRYKKNEKVHNIIISDLNTYSILSYYLNGKSNKILEYLYQNIKTYLVYNYKQLLEKESSFACHWLSRYLENPDEFKKDDTATKSGYFVQEKTDVLLKYLFGNYLAISGKNSPDGIICLKDNEAFIVDCKQHKTLSKAELVKVRDYALSYRKDEVIHTIKGGILVITKKIIENGSLNPNTRNDILKDDVVSLNFLSLEFILNLYEILSQKFLIAPEIRTFIRDCGLEVIKKSQGVKTVSDLSKIETNEISKLRSQIEIYEKYHYPTQKELL
ncbi:MAG: hypothetical protein JXA98_09015 [Methanosarcinaceae archaeon]|nr:hypothetical protein [Methanosarcinaceae archaeon]